MKLYYHPASTTSRPLMLFAEETGMKVDLQLVDLFTGAHHQPEFEALNPNKQVPVLVDGDFRLTESCAILRYMAEKSGSSLYPKDLQERARANERMDWVNTQLNRDLCYGLVYPQAFPSHKRPTEEVQKATLAWAKERAAGWLKVLNYHLIGPKNGYLCGDKITLADYYGAPFVALVDVIRADLAAYPNIKRWLGNMKRLKSWAKTNEVMDGFAGSLKGPFETV